MGPFHALHVSPFHFTMFCSQPKFDTCSSNSTVNDHHPYVVRYYHRRRSLLVFGIVSIGSSINSDFHFN
uniref:Uncharacterized protein n=1 Tax=Cucumis melo TaxID=3656 RepID=A0A9I9EIY8_CUCME